MYKFQNNKFLFDENILILIFNIFNLLLQYYYKSFYIKLKNLF